MVISRAGSVFQFDSDVFRDKYPQHGFKTAHSLCAHPLLDMNRLQRLAGSLPEDLVEYYSGKVGFSQSKRTYPKNGLSILDTLRNLEQTTSWMVLRQVERDPEYAELLNTLLDEVTAQWQGMRPHPATRDMHRQHAFIFISSPYTVTPCHVDDEHSFLMQVRGTKRVAMWEHADRSVMTEAQAESMLEFWHDEQYDCYLPYRDDFLPRAAFFDLSPGEALHFPFGAPHWVKNGPEVSVSFSITYRTLMSERLAVVYHMNKRMRRLGFQPTPPNHTPWLDDLKFKSFVMARRASRRIKRTPVTDPWR